MEGGCLARYPFMGWAGRGGGSLLRPGRGDGVVVSLVRPGSFFFLLTPGTLIMFNTKLINFSVM